MDIERDENSKKKSPKQRFLFVIGMIFFLVYLGLGLVIIFWEEFPLAMEQRYRVAFGALLIVYAFIRFTRLLRSEN
ncbi:MAG TPA: hypothetical protein VGB50_02925 [Flavobacterium sp.]|jgi:uncharacterized membrane protein (DUF485 family)